MLVCARADCNNLSRAAGRLNGVWPGAAVTGGDSYVHSCLDSIVEPDRQQIVVTLKRATKRQIENIHSLSDGRIHRVQDILAASVGYVAGKHVVVPKPGARRHSGHVPDAHAVHYGMQGHIKYPGGDPGSVRPMVLDGLRVEVLLVVLVEENLGNNHLWRDVLAVLVWVVRSAVGRIALRKPGRIAERGWVEERMQVADSSVDVSNVDPGTGVGSAACGHPSSRRINNVIALAQARMVEGVVLHLLHHRRCCY